MNDTLDRRSPHVSAQVAASFAAWEREAMNGELSKQDEALQSALEETKRVIRDFIDDNGTPGPRGPRSTQHGEIAERVTVGIRRASAILEREIPDATFDGVGRKGPVDYLIGDVPIQSKYAGFCPKRCKKSSITLNNTDPNSSKAKIRRTALSTFQPTNMRN